MLERTDDTIVAVSSPAGAGVRGIVRLSGPDALFLAGQVFTPAQGPALTGVPGRRRVHGHAHLDETARLPAEAYVFRAPASYTRQDMVELHIIGAPPLLAILVDALIVRGARPAQPGEFTARAFFAGALDLTQVEAVAAVINARSDTQLRASQALLHGSLARRTIDLRERLADLLSLIEAEIDFAEEPIDFVSPRQVHETVSRTSDELRALLADAVSVERLETLPEVMLAGPPNAGKSTLFNRLTGMDRAIASATAGTTRDVLAAPAPVPGGEVMLLDSAGLTTTHGAAASRITLEHAARTLTRRRMVSADLVLFVVPITGLTAETVRPLRKMIARSPCRILASKVDLVTPAQRRELLGGGSISDAIAVSALTGEGIDTLRHAIAESLFPVVESRASEVMALSNRHRRALSDALAALDRAGLMCCTSSDVMACAELLAIEIREAMNALSLLSGQVTTEDLLERVFSRFCIGK